jgi:DNA-binding transcriptional ArsR family regulator
MTGKSPEPGWPGNPVKVSDPRMLRAVAHPARVKILAFLATEGPATATECAAVAGLSPSACSYHLRALAQYGFVEEDRASTTDGRQRPWRCRILSLQWDSKAMPGMELAGQLLEETLRTEVDEMRAAYLDRKSEYPHEWQEVLGNYTDVLHVTPEELEDFQKEMVEFFGRYRRLSPDERPPGAKRVSVLVDFNPWFAPDEPGGEAA